VAVENALRKAQAVRNVAKQESVLGVDTLVAFGDRIYGKPPDETAARETLRVLAGATHTVFSGLALITDGREQLVTASTEVRFRELSDELIDWYLAIKEWRGRAGGYAIQGMGSTLVLEIRGEYENVVGLPVAALLDMCPGLLWNRGPSR
jgi:septum formation protein